jgi:hypothetical protein
MNDLHVPARRRVYTFADPATVINRVASKLYTLEGIFCIPATR